MIILLDLYNLLLNITHHLQCFISLTQWGLVTYLTPIHEATLTNCQFHPQEPQFKSKCKTFHSRKYTSISWPFYSGLNRLNNRNDINLLCDIRLQYIEGYNYFYSNSCISDRGNGILFISLIHQHLEELAFFCNRNSQTHFSERKSQYLDSNSMFFGHRFSLTIRKH